MRKFHVGLVLAIAFVSAEASVCVPGVIPNITLFSNYSLYWSDALNPEKCTINYFIIDIIDSESEIQYQLQTSRSVYVYNLINVLDMCKAYTFEVHALTNESIVGPSIKYVATTAALIDVNLSLTPLNVSVTASEIDVTWNLRAPDVFRCVSYYRVVYWEETNTPRDVYVTTNNFPLSAETPCSIYTFQVSAIIANPDLEGPITETNATGFPQAPDVPSLVSLVTTNTSVTTVWRLEPFAQNRCKLSNLNVYTLGVAANISALHYPIPDNVLRPNLNITITGLAPDSVYVSTVNVGNTAGNSKNVTVNYQTTNTFVFDFDLNLTYL